MGIKKHDEAQLPLFDINEPMPPHPPSIQKPFKKKQAPKPTSVVDFVRARFEANPNMTEEEYKRWIKVLIQSSLKRME